MLIFVRCLVAITMTGTLMAVSAGAPPLAEPVPGPASFAVFLRATPAGIEQVSLERAADGWTIRSSSELASPFGVSHRSSEVQYDLDWRPKLLTTQGRRHGSDFSVRTSFGDGSATNRVSYDDQTGESKEPADPTSIVLPDYFFGAYEALAVRLDGLDEGDGIPVYAAPRGPMEAVVVETLRQQLDTTEGKLSVHIYRVTLRGPDELTDTEVWVDDRHRLVRVTLPRIDLDVVRQDISLMSTRLTGVEIPGDTDVRVPVRGFSLATTITIPEGRPTPSRGWPAVVLVPGTRSTDRDEHLSGVPVFGQLAATLSASGAVVARYDRRGVGQSGGRPESATLENYADDARAVVRYLEDRDDVDPDRITLVAHGEGGWIGLQAASQEDRVAALILLATPGVEGAAYVLERQQMELDQLGVPPAEREERTAMQRRIQDAVVGHGSWDNIPDDIRRQADTPWFRSLLTFDPAETISRTDQPILIVHGDLDDQVPIHHATRLADMARLRRHEESPVELVTLAGINHLMMTTETSASADYAALAHTTLAGEVTAALTDWLDRNLAPRR